MTAHAISRLAPVINDVTDALDHTTCFFERLRVLLSSALGELHDLTLHMPDGGGAVSATVVNRLYDNWLIFEVAGEKLAELEQIVCAINEKAHAERRAVSA